MTEDQANKPFDWNFDNSYARLPESFFSKVAPTPVREPKLAIFNEPLAETLGLHVQALRNNDVAAVLTGNRIPDGALPIAQAYGGHQFGHFTMLGDGRAILLGEQITPSGARLDIQLKGAGITPYSRRGDGRAALGPMLREYVISEAMHALGIPTTRSLAVVTTGQPVFREEALPGAVLTRVANSHLRVGTFQYAAKWCTVEQLRKLADYAIQRHDSEMNIEENEGNRYLSLLQAVIRRQAALIAKWQLVGFVHGVMNTDNMAISGETIDYGPCAFMDTYDPGTVFSSIDRQGRYAYGNQPYIAAWNLARFAESLLPLLHEDEDQAVKLAEDTIAGFSEAYKQIWLAGMRSKLGLLTEESEDENLIEGLLNLMKEYKADYTNTFLALTFDQLKDESLFVSESFAQWHEQWRKRLGRQPQAQDETYKLMENSNPAVIPRNHRVEEALEAAEQRDDFSVLEQLLDVLAKPYSHTGEREEYAAPPSRSSGPYRTYCGT